MSLHHIAQHLKDQGRGPDDMLVHMTSGEVKSLQDLAKAHGGSLTINPSTGLPEAGFLSSILPMAAGALAVATGNVELLPYIAAGVGVADYAMTGSLTKGLMAGLSTWSGGELTAGLSAAGGAELAQQGANAAETAFQSGQSAIGAGGASLPEGVVPTETGAFNTATGADITPQSIGQGQLSNMNLPAGTSGMFNNAIDSAKSLPEMTNIMGGAGAAATNPTVGQGLAQGITSTSAIGSTIANNPMAAAGAALPLLSGATNLFKQPTVPGVTQQTSSNPFGLKTIPRDANGNPIFNASIPAVPNPHYQATYPNYVQNPYTSTVTAADGGLMQGGPVNVNFMGSDMYPQSQQQRSYYATPTQMPTSAQQTMASYEPKTNPLTGEPMIGMASGGLANIPRYSGADYGSMVTGASEMQQGLAQATRPKDLTDMEKALVEAGQERSKSGVYHLSDLEYSKLSPTAVMKANKIAIAKGLQPIGQLGDYETTTAAQQAAEAAAKEDIAANSKKTSAKEGGLMAAGGSVDGHLGSYSDGGRLLKGPGDGVSDGIPATISGKQPARLADGEFVIPARIVSELGNGSTDAGAKRLYAMMDRIKNARKKSKDIAADTKAYKYLPA